MAAQFSVYTPQGLGTVPPATIAQNFLPAFGQGLLQVVKTYQARKSVEEAADQASKLFGDPTYGNIFRQMGLAAVAQGESPTPIINSMLSTAITLKRDQDQRSQQEQMMRLQFGQQTAMENLRTTNNLKEFGARADYAEEQGSYGNRYRDALTGIAATAQAQEDFSRTDTGKRALESQRVLREQKIADEAASAERNAYSREQGKFQAREDRGLPLLGTLEEETELIIQDLGIDLETNISELEFNELEDMERSLLSAGAKGTDVQRRIAPTLRAIQEQKRILLDKDKREEQKDLKAPKTQPSPPAANKYLKL